MCMGANVSKPSKMKLAARRQIVPSPRQGLVPLSRAQTHSQFWGAAMKMMPCPEAGWWQGSGSVSWQGLELGGLQECRERRGANTDLAP